MKKYFAVGPNVSNGKDPEIYEKIIDVVKNAEDIKLIKVNVEGDFNRTCIRFIGEEEALMNTLVDLTSKCKELIDMGTHKGSHPRMGALDYCPIYPFKNATIEDTVTFAKKLGKRIFNELKVPVYLSGEAATTEERKTIQFIRKGQYEGLSELLKEIKDSKEREKEYILRAPDYSVDGLLDEKFGGCVLVPAEHKFAYLNIFIDTEDLEIAKKIASAVRRIGGGFSTVTAIGIKFEGTPGTVLSLNIDDCYKTPIYRPFEFVMREAERYGVRITGSELLGQISLDFVIDCFRYQFRLNNFKREDILETYLMS